MTKIGRNGELQAYSRWIVHVQQAYNELRLARQTSLVSGQHLKARLRIGFEVENLRVLDSDFALTTSAPRWVRLQRRNVSQRSKNCILIQMCRCQVSKCIQSFSYITGLHSASHDWCFANHAESFAFVGIIDVNEANHIVHFLVFRNSEVLFQGRSARWNRWWLLIDVGDRNGEALFNLQAKHDSNWDSLDELLKPKRQDSLFGSESRCPGTAGLDRERQRFRNP